jgi:hypothetical protein
MRYTPENQDQLRHVAWLAVTDWCRENSADDSRAREAAEWAVQDWLRRIAERPTCQRDTALNYAILHAIEEFWPSCEMSAA